LVANNGDFSRPTATCHRSLATQTSRLVQLGGPLL
jgi:hypothetical protein